MIAYWPSFFLILHNRFYIYVFSSTSQIPISPSRLALHHSQLTHSLTHSLRYVMLMLHLTFLFLRVLTMTTTMTLIRTLDFEP